MKTIPDFKIKMVALFSLFMLIIYSSHAQDNLPKRALQITGGYAELGSGDMKGIGFGTEYIRYGSGRMFLNYNLRSTINYSKHEIILNDPNTGSSQDASIRFTTAGIQLGVDAGFAFVRNKLFNASISLGGFVRYQSASNGSDGYNLYFPAATGLPLVLVEYANKTPQQTVHPGGLLQLQLDVHISRQMYIGVIPRFQTDTNGDAILFLGLAVGRKF